MTTYDFVAIGLGPFNLGLACLTDPLEDLNGVFLEAEDEFAWHPGMMLEDATLQVPFLADLVTMADPTSRFSFLNFLKETGRLYPFYIRESFFPLRAEYNQYCQWAAGRLESVRFGHRVEEITFEDDLYVVRVRCSGELQTYRARRIVLGTGTRPQLPPAARDLEGPAIHSADYLDHKAALQSMRSITIVGSGQSAAEVYLDLLEDIHTFGYELNWVTRSPRFYPLEYTKLTLEMTSPEYTAYFQSLPGATRERLLVEQKSLYKGISSELVNTIFDTLYRKRVHGDFTSNLLSNCELTGASYDADRGEYALGFFHTELGESFPLQTEGLVFAAGYAPGVPDFIDPIRERIRWDHNGRFAADGNYAIDNEGSGIFVQNAEEHTHGFVAPDLGMGAFRNSSIIAAMLGREVYRVEQRIAFQNFGLPGRSARKGLGKFSLESLDPERDAESMHAWVTHPQAAFWGMQSATIAEVRDGYERVEADPHHDAFLGRVDDEPSFLFERYDPAHSELSAHYEVEPGDVGMHVLVAPTDSPQHGFTAEVMRTVMEFLFDDPRCDRVVVEPDIGNEKIAALNAAAGFVIEKKVQLKDKTAALSFSTREQFASSRLGGSR